MSFVFPSVQGAAIQRQVLPLPLQGGRGGSAPCGPLWRRGHGGRRAAAGVSGGLAPEGARCGAQDDTEETVRTLALLISVVWKMIIN